MDATEPSTIHLFLVGAISIYCVVGSVAAVIAILQSAMSGDSFAAPQREEILSISREIQYYVWYPFKAFVGWPYYVWQWVKGFNEINEEDPDRSHLD